MFFLKIVKPEFLSWEKICLHHEKQRSLIETPKHKPNRNKAPTWQGFLSTPRHQIHAHTKSSPPNSSLIFFQHDLPSRWAKTFAFPYLLRMPPLSRHHFVLRGGKSAWFSLTSWGSWRLALLMAKLQRDVWRKQLEGQAMDKKRRLQRGLKPRVFGGIVCDEIGKMEFCVYLG